jgi:glycosidase
VHGYQDPDNRRDFPGGLPGNKRDDVFQASTRTSDQSEMFDWTSKLLALRRNMAVLQTGNMQILYTSYDSIVYARQEGNQRILIAIHRGIEDVNLYVNTAQTDPAGHSTSSHIFGEGNIQPEANGVKIELPANGGPD